MPALETLPTGVMCSYDAGFRVAAVGATYRGNPTDWSLRPLWSNPHQRLPAEHAVARHLCELCTVLRIRTLYAPTPVFGTQVTRTTEMHQSVIIPHEKHSVRIFLGKSADALQLGPGDTWAISVGGCAALTLHHPGNREAKPRPTYWSAHCGRDNVVDPNRSVVAALLRASRSLVSRAERHRMLARIYFPIPPSHFTHPFHHREFGELNRARCEHIVRTWGPDCIEGWNDPLLRLEGRIDIAEVITAQLVAEGIPNDNIHVVGKQIAGNPEEWHTTRGPEEHRKKRNLVLVTAI